MKAVRHIKVHFTTCCQLSDHQAFFRNSILVKQRLQQTSKNVIESGSVAFGVHYTLFTHMVKLSLCAPWKWIAKWGGGGLATPILTPALNTRQSVAFTPAHMKVIDM